MVVRLFPVLVVACGLWILAVSFMDRKRLAALDRRRRRITSVAFGLTFLGATPRTIMRLLEHMSTSYALALVGITCGLLGAIRMGTLRPSAQTDSIVRQSPSVIAMAIVLVFVADLGLLWANRQDRLSLVILGAVISVASLLTAMIFLLPGRRGQALD